MSYAQGFGRQSCSLLAVFCGQFSDRPRRGGKGRPSYPFPELVSCGRLEVQTLANPSTEKFSELQKLIQPNIVYFQGEQLENEEQIGSLIWGTVDVSDPETLSSLLSSPLPTIVYLEVPHGENIAQALHSKGVPYVIYWKSEFSSYAASHFCQALLSVVQSSCSHTWDAFPLAQASFRFYCLDAKQKSNTKLGPHLLGDAPKINIPQREQEMGEEEEEGSSDALRTVKIFDEEIELKFLVCGLPFTLDSCLMSALADGLNALLNIEIRGSKLQNRVSAAPPPLQAVSRGLVTMRCDITTCSSAHISLLVSGSAQTCFDDQLLEGHIKSEVIEKSQLVHVLPYDVVKPSSIDPLSSISVACGATVFEICMRVPNWAAQVLKHLAPEVSYRSLVTLGIASIQGTPVASFEKEDADRLLFFCNKGADQIKTDVSFSCPPRLFACLTKERSLLSPESKPVTPGKLTEENGASSATINQNVKVDKRLVGISPVTSSSRQKFKVAFMRPIPHSRKHKMLPYMGGPLSDANDGSHVQANSPAVPSVKLHVVPPAATTHRKSTSSSLKAQQMIPVNPLPMKKHGCDRPPIQVCSEEEFLKDVMQFLILRGHSRLVPQGGISEFPDAILNAKRLDLFNLYREVVSRGGFYVGNGINWKGQVFSKMRNHTATNRMTGVGNTLKRHYETYLLEYELAHDDVDGECCLLCHSSAPGDWVNCGLCGEWAHFGCDRRQGLGTFKDYAKTDGLEYICPHCSITNYKKKTQKLANGFSNASRHV